MSHVRLDSVVTVNPRALGLELSDDASVTFVPMAAVSESTLKVENPEVRPYCEVKKGYTYFSDGDVIVAKITPCYENGKMALATEMPEPTAFGSTEFHVFRATNGLDNRYLFHFLRNPMVQAAGAKKMKGAAGQKRVPADFFKSLNLYLPPLDEQKRIAAILDKVDELRAKRREAIAELDKLVQATFLDMFGDPVTNPKGWPISALEDLIDDKRPITYGILKPGADVLGGIPYVRVVDIKDNRVLVDQLRRTTPEIASQYRRSTLAAGDLLFSIRGHVGRMAINPQEAEGANITQDTARLAVTKCSTPYVQYALATSGMQHFISRRVKGVAVKGINLGDLRKLPIPVPPDQLQKRFTDLVDMIVKQKEDLTAHAESLEQLFAALQHRAFNGDL